ncbi:MAG: hypothetical protein WEB53_12445 [Akkermansiaceae bacterium]
MSDETSLPPENPPSPEAKAAPRARRVSTPRPKKVAKSGESAAVKEEKAAPISVEPTQAPVPEPVNEFKPASSDADWPEPEAASTGNSAQGEGAKRKRRRRKGKGQGAPQAAAPFGAENSAGQTQDLSEPFEQAPGPPRPAAPQPTMKPPAPPQPAPPRPRIDPELLTKMAWKIYLAEVSEEGVALIGDNDAKDLSRRCFRLAEIFIEEQTRRR